jgi:hypothetical protein
MVPPLSDIHASCEQCHPDDLEDRAQVYADELGIVLTSDGTSQGTGGQPSTTLTTTSTTTSSTSPTGSGTSLLSRRISADDPNVVDYRKRYDEIVLGKRDTNWGNIALIILIELLIVGGSSFVVMNELRRRRMRTVDQQYPEDVVEMLPALSGLKAQTRRALSRLLSNPQIDKVLSLIETVVSNDKPAGGDK